MRQNELHVSLASSQYNPDRCTVRSPLSTPAFWVAQVAGWTFAVAVFIGFWVVTMPKDSPWGEVAAVFVLTICVAIATSSALAWSYTRLPEKWLERGRLVFVVLVFSVAAAIPWVAVIYFTLDEMSWASVRSPLVPFNIVQMITLLVGWSAVFLTVHLSNRFQQARVQVLKTESLAHQAKLQSLRAQLNPHFLFNSINSVIGLVDVDPSKSKDMMRDFAALLRRALDSTDLDTTTIDEELDFVAQYLRCEEIRFGDGLRVRIDVSDDLRSLSIPSMLLQPLVENAIKHGLGGSEQLDVEISGRAVRDRVVLEVRNTGKLAATAAQNAVDSEVGPKSPTRGAGLQLVRERLAARYPESAHFELVQEQGWVTARVRYAPGETNARKEAQRSSDLAPRRPSQGALPEGAGQ